MGKVFKIDSRWFPIVNNSILLFLALAFYYFLIPLQVVILSFLVGIGTEYVLFRLTNKYPEHLWRKQILSPLTTTLSILLIVRSFEIWVYLPVVALAIASKYILYTKEQGHIFNPGNFGIVVAYCLVPSGWIGMYPNQFSLDTYPVLQTILLGMMTTFFVNRYLLPASFLLSTLFIGLILHAIGWFHFIDILGPELGVSSLILIFFMMTDPKTSPEKFWHQILFGIAMAIVNLLLKLNEVIASQIFALFLVSPLYFWLKTLASQGGVSRRFFKKMVPKASES